MVLTMALSSEDVLTFQLSVSLGWTVVITKVLSSEDVLTFQLSVSLGWTVVITMVLGICKWSCIVTLLLVYLCTRPYEL